MSRTTEKGTRVPVILLTGFLGAGKTTFLNRLLSGASMGGTAVIINEFGSVSIDDSLIVAATETMIELASGCVCCAMVGTLGETLRGLAATGLDSIDRVVIETTGLANAGPIVHTIVADDEIARSFRFDRVVTLVDCANAMMTLNRHPESVEQIAIADCLLLSKTDLVPSPGMAAIVNRLELLNPTGHQFVADNGSVNISAVLDAPTKLEYEPAVVSSVAELGPHDAHINTVTLLRAKPLDENELKNLWARIANRSGANLLRVKGLVNVDRRNGPAVIQGAQDVMSRVSYLDTWPSEDRRTRLVFIGWDLDEAELDSLLPA